MNDNEEEEGERRRRDEPTTTLFGVIENNDERGAIAMAARGGLALAVLAPRSTRNGLAAGLSVGREAWELIIVQEKGGRLFEQKALAFALSPMGEKRAK